MGILHRDLRAANVLVDSLDPLQIRVADFGVSHLLSAFARGEMYKGASKVTSVLTGAAALGPLQVCICGCGCGCGCGRGCGSVQLQLARIVRAYLGVFCHEHDKGGDRSF